MHAMMLSVRRLSYLRSLAFSLNRKPVLWLGSSPYYNHIALFSSSETGRKILSVEDVEKMLVADLKNELRSRGSTVSGKKAELQQRLFEILSSEKSAVSVPLMDVHVEKKPVEIQPPSNHILKYPVTSNSEFASHFGVLDTALNEKNSLKFEETMKAMETMVRTVPTTTLSSDEMNQLAAKLRVWSETETVSSESIASVLKSAGYLGLTVKGKDGNKAVVEEIIEKYLQENNKSTRSIAIFFTALRKVGVSLIRPFSSELFRRFLPLITTLVEAEDLDIRSYSESLMALAKLQLKWDNFPAEARRKCLSRLNEMKPKLDIPSLDILARAFKSLLPFTGGVDHRTFVKIICDLSLQGLQIMETGTREEKQVNERELSSL
jgi:hypothetical protein